MTISISFYKVLLKKERTRSYRIPKSIQRSSDSYLVVKKVLNAHRETQEVFGAIFLNTRNDILGIQEIHRGTVSTVHTSSRDLFKAALLHNAAGIIVFHNHPSNSARPSKEDYKMMSSFIRAGEIMQIPVLDHLIVTYDDYFSFWEHDTLYKRG